VHRILSNVGRAVVGSTVIALLFAFSFLGALHAPRPNDLPVGLAGPPEAVDAVARQLDSRAPGGFDISRYPDEEAARTALEDREVDGAFVLGPDGPTLLVAGAAGMITRNALTETFSQAAAAAGQSLQVEDVRALPADDRAGISSFLFVVTVLVPSLICAVMIAQLGGRNSPRSKMLAAITAALSIGLLNAWAVTGIYGALSGHYLEVAGIAALLSAAVSLPALALHRAIGAPGLGVAGLLFVVFGMPATGGAIGPSFIPDLFATFSSLLPGGEAIAAVRSVVYFDGASIARPLWSLAAWAATGALLLLPGGAARHRERQPSAGQPLVPATPSVRY